MGHDTELPETIKGYLQAFRNPHIPPEKLRELLDAVSGLLDTVAPSEGEFTPKGGWAPQVSAQALQMERALEQVLAEYDAAERKRARYLEARERFMTALRTMGVFMQTMPGLLDAENVVGTGALGEGFEVLADGTVHTPPGRDIGADSGAVERRRAELQDRMIAAVTARQGLMNGTVDALRELLGIGTHQPGIPWVIEELTREDVDTDFAEPFAAAIPIMSDCELKDLLSELVALIGRARTASRVRGAQ